MALVIKAKFCFCDQKNKHLAEVTDQEALDYANKVKNAVEAVLKLLPMQEYPYERKTYFGGLASTFEIIGNPGEECGTFSEERDAALNNNYNLVIVQRSDSDVADGAVGEKANIIDLLINASERTMQHEFGHAIGFEHPEAARGNSFWSHNLMFQEDGINSVGSTLNYLQWNALFQVATGRVAENRLINKHALNVN